MKDLIENKIKILSTKRLRKWLRWLTLYPWTTHQWDRSSIPNEWSLQIRTRLSIANHKEQQQHDINLKGDGEYKITL